MESSGSVASLHDRSEPKDKPHDEPRDKGKRPAKITHSAQSPPASNPHQPTATNHRTLSDPTTHLQTSHNPFDTSFAAALANPSVTYDGHADDFDERTPLLDSYYNPSSQPLSAKRSKSAPLKPPGKASPSRGICLWHECNHSSQYTRPAAEILREVLDERGGGPTGEGAGGDGNVDGHGRAEGRQSQAGERAKWKRKWLRRVLGRRGTGA